MFDRSLSRSVFDLLGCAGWVEGEVCKPGTLWICRIGALFSRYCFTSSFSVVKLSLNLGSRKVAVFTVSCGCLSSYLCSRLFHILLSSDVLGYSFHPPQLFKWKRSPMSRVGQRKEDAALLVQRADVRAKDVFPWCCCMSVCFLVLYNSWVSL